MIIRKAYMDKIAPYIDSQVIKILSGVRRSGKSTILKMLADELVKRGVNKNRILAYNFDSLQHEDIKTAKLLYENVKQRLLSKNKTYLFFDSLH